MDWLAEKPEEMSVRQKAGPILPDAILAWLHIMASYLEWLNGHVHKGIDKFCTIIYVQQNWNKNVWVLHAEFTFSLEYAGVSLL